MSRLSYPGQPEMGVHLSHSVTHHSLAFGYCVTGSVASRLSIGVVL